MSAGRGVHQLFEIQARQTPDAPAVRIGSRVVSYRQLNAQANALAHRIAARVGRDSLVGLLADRSVEMVAGILGILKAGAAYVPLNPEYPVERLAFVARDAGLDALVTTPGLDHIAAILSKDAIAFPTSDERDDDPEVGVMPTDLAYAIYTSGSTGQPKGVCLQHAGLLSLIAFTKEQMRIGPDDRVLQFATFSFDASLWEILVALTSGASIVLGSTDELMPGPPLHALLRRHGVTIALLSPSVLQILPPDDLDALRIVVAGTEKLTGAIVSRWKRPTRRFFNAYGPTEATIYQTIWEAPDGPPPDNPPIGAAIPGVDAYVLDETLAPVAAGESGELCLAGPCLGRGYINRPELTGEKFVTLPLGPGGQPVRVYRTGDRVRRLSDGSYEYHGRLDLQIKVRGFRVEPGEIEATLERHPGVESSAVVGSADATGQMRLWAYVIPRAAPAPSARDLRTFLARRLPDYMIPSGFSMLHRWPLNANGKLARERLPSPGSDAVVERENEQQPASIERQVLTWCREILGDRRLQPADRLTDVGFHSLAFAQLAWRLQDAFGWAPTFSEMFARPTVTDLAAWVDKTGATHDAARDSVSIVDRNSKLPLSSAQERVWFLERLHPGNNAYRFQSILKFHGSLNAAALEHALNDIVERHEILRTTFPHEGGRPFQRIHPHTHIALTVDEVSEAEAGAAIERIIQEPFDVARLPLVRWRLFRIGREEHWLLHTEHHFLHDGWGYGVFLSELFACYDARAAGQEPSLPSLPAQFADLAAWQQRQIASGRWTDQLDYWEKKLAAPPGPPELPTDRARPSTETFTGAQIRHPLDPGLYAELVAACTRERVTPYMWLHAAFQAFLFRYTGQPDIIVGSGFANRRPSAAQRLLGMMINTVAIRTSFDGDPSFRDVLAQIRLSSVAAADNQDAPYDKVIARLGSGTTLFNAFFDSYDQAFPGYRNDVMEVESLDGICNGRVKFDLTALLIPGQTAPLLLWEYNADLFEAATAERLMRHFLTLLAASVAQPDSAVRRLGMLSDDERRWMRQMSGGKDAPGTGERIDQVFVAIARTQPDAEAVVCGRERWTYHELDRRAEALAERLREAGVASCGVVAFERPRGPEAVAAMLAILKCGCAYLPLEPGIPAARRDALLTIVGPSAVITAGVVNALPSASGGTSTHPSPRADDAYVLFTSGSTGVPKAVFAPHRGVLRLVRHVDYVRLDASVRFLQLAPLAFDASTLEIWGPLLNGGTVVILPEEVPALTELGRVLAEERVTTAWLTASLFNRIIDSAPEILRPLRQVLTGGEALSVPHVVRALAELPDTAVINGYGPTETTTFATAFAVPRPFDPASSRVPIGSPIPDTQVYVLDEQREIQPIGVAGEIFIGGGGVGRFADRTLEDAAFVINPFSTTPGARLYRSGDRGRMLSDGTFDCLGRLDRQLKIRGRRIEPGEIESVLRRHPDVREVAVLAPPDAAGERRLVAYVTPVAVRTSDAATAAATLREFAAAVLPDYLVPSHIVFVPSLPLSTTGKIDAIALEQLAIEPSAGNHDGHIAPRTPLEAVVAGVWASVLRLESSSIDDNFFDVGGHSLLALQLIHELNVALGLNLPTRLIFIEPTIAGIARAIECELAAQFGKTKQYEALVPIKPGGTRPPFFLVAGGVGGEAELVVYAGLSRYLDARQPFFGLRARGVDELIEPHENVEKMAAEYIQEIRRVQPSGPYVIGGSCVGGVVALEMAQQLQHAGQELRALVLIDSFVPRWSRFMRNEIVNFWSLRLRPELQWAKANGFFEYARIWRRRLVNPTPEEESAQRQVEVMRTYLARLTAYKPRRYDGRVILLRAANPRAEDPVTRWRSIMNGPFEVHDIPGDHFTHLREHAKATAECLDKCLRS